MIKHGIAIADERSSTADGQGLGQSPETHADHRRHKTSIWSHLRNARLAVALTAPVIYACTIPFLFLDLFVTIYQAVCFPIYGIPKVRRGDYLVFDRGKLAYLNAIEKVGCVYCSYANGLLAYITEIAGRTEQYFCPIRHAHPLIHPHSRYPHFVQYGNARAFRTESKKVETDFGDVAPGAK